MEKEELLEIDMQNIRHADSKIDYYDGDIAIIDNIKQLSINAPYYAKMNILLICMKGMLEFHANDYPKKIYAGEILISAPYVVLDSFLVSPDFECKIICLSDDIIQALLHQNIEHWNLNAYSQRLRILSLPDEDREQIVYYYNLIRFKINHKDRPYHKIVMQAIVQAVLYDICSFMDKGADVEHNNNLSHAQVIFNKFISLLSNRQGVRQTVSKYAADLYISPKYLTMICSKYSGKSAMDWITQYTKEEIRYYLCHTDLSVKEICIKLGFANLSFFGSYVRKHFGMPPVRLRQAYKRKQ